MHWPRRGKASAARAAGATGRSFLEMFDVFNHSNYGSYVTDESSRAYGQPVQNLAIEYQPRMMQLGVRVAF